LQVIAKLGTKLFVSEFFLTLLLLLSQFNKKYV
jgi:hypothetical protein